MICARSILAFFILLSYNVIAQIPNNDFEYWEPDVIYDRPIGWTTNNGENPGTGVQQDTNAYSGNYAIHLSSGSDYVIHAQTGFPLSFHPQFLKAYIRTYRYTNDITQIGIRLYSNGIVVDSADSNITVVSHYEYLLFHLPIPSNSTVCDSAVIQLVASSPSLSQASSELWVDHLWFDDDFIGIENTENDKGFLLFPNPAESIINVASSSSPIKPTSLIVRDMAGRIYLQQEITANTSVINIDQLPAGIYFMNIKEEDRSDVRKFVKR